MPGGELIWKGLEVSLGGSEYWRNKAKFSWLEWERLGKRQAGKGKP